MLDVVIANTSTTSCTTHMHMQTTHTELITPRAHARSGVKQSVSQSVTRKKLKSRHIDMIDPHKPSKWSQTIANTKKLLYVYLTEVKSLRFVVFRLFSTFHNYS